MLRLIFLLTTLVLTAGCSHLGRRSTDKIQGALPQVEIYGNGKDGGKTPTLKPPKIRIRHVDDQIKDGVFIPAHLEYEITEQVRWEE